MKHVKSAQIGERGENLFRTLLPDNWQSRKLAPDFGIDFQIEVFDGEQPAGLKFSCQVKATQSPAGKKHKAFVVEIETDHLAYFVDKTREPVFLVLIDVECKKGYWLFVQGYEKEVLRKARPEWRRQKSVSIGIPATNVLTGVKRFREAIEESLIFMSELYPGSIGSAIEKERAKIVKLDPRWDVQVSANAGAVQYTLSAKEDLSFGMSITAEWDRLRQIDKDLRIGREVQLEGYEVRLQGSPLFDQMLGEFDTVVIAAPQKKHGHLTLSAHGADDCVLASVDSIPATVTSGGEGFLIRAGLLRSPLSIDVEMDVSQYDRKRRCGSAPTRISFQLNQWTGQFLNSLAYFDQIAALYRAIACGGRWGLRLSLDGNAVWSLVSHEHSQPNEDNLHTIEILAKGRDLVRRSELMIRLPVLTNRHIWEIERLHALLIQGELAESCPGFAVTFSLQTKDIVKNAHFWSMRGAPVTLLGISNGPQEWPLLGQNVDVGRIAMTFESLAVANADSLIRAIEGPGTSEMLEVVLEGTSESRAITRKVDTQAEKCSL